MMIIGIGVSLLILAIFFLSINGGTFFTILPLIFSICICILGILILIRKKFKKMFWLKYVVLGMTFCIMILPLFAKSITPLKTVPFDNEYFEKMNELDQIDLLITNKKYEEAKTLLQEYYKGKNNDDAYYLLYAKIILGTDSNKSNAINTINRVKRHGKLYYKLLIEAQAGIQFTHGKVPESLLNTVQDAVRDFPDEVDFVYLASVLCYDSDMYGNSAYYSNLGIGLEPNNAKFHYYYGLSVYLMGDKEEGIKSMKKAKEYADGNDELLKSIETYIKYMEEGVR